MRCVLHVGTGATKACVRECLRFNSYRPHSQKPVKDVSTRVNGRMKLSTAILVHVLDVKGELLTTMKNDLISRQALCEYALNQKDKSVTPTDIMRFPSAQPEIIRCKDCKHAKITADGKYMKYCSQWDVDDALYLDGDFFCGHAERRTDG